MALHDVSRLTDALATLFQPKIVSTVNRSVVALQILPYEAGPGAKNLSWDAEFKASDEATDSSIADGADVTVYQDDNLVPAVLQWGTYSEAFGVTGKALAIAAATGNPDDLVDLFSQKMDRAIRRLCKNLGKDLWQGTGATNKLHGFYGGATLATNAPLAATGTYAAIDRATYADWKGNVLANGGVARPLTFQLMRDTRRTVYEKTGLMPDVIFCDPFQHEQYGLLFGAQRRYVQEITVRGQRIVLDGGYRALEFDGIPVIADVNHPAGAMTFFTSESVKVRQLPDRATAANRSPGMVGLYGSGEEQIGSGTTRLTARINVLAVTGDAYKVQLILYPQVQVERPNGQAVLTDLAQS